MFVAHLILQRIEAQQCSDGERGTGAETGTGRQVGYVMHFHAFLNAKILQAGANRRVLKVVVRIHVFDSRIRDPAVIFEKRRQVAARDVAAFVDGGGQHGAAKFTIPDGVIGATAEE